MPPFATIAKIPGFDADAIARFLMDPHPKMPDMQLSRDGGRGSRRLYRPAGQVMQGLAAHAAISPPIGVTPSVSGNTALRERVGGEAEMVGEHALEHGAQVGRRFEIALLIEIGGLQARPIGDDAPAVERAAGEQGDRRRFRGRCRWCR